MNGIWIMRQATTADLNAVVDVLNEAGERLARAGLDQWGVGWMNRDRMASPIARGETYVACGLHDEVLATVTLSPAADRDFWTAAECADQAIYMSKLARRASAPSGIGTWIASSWAPSWAYRHGYDRVRLDAWRSNPELHTYYRRTGWSHLRTEAPTGRQSGALFERLAAHAVEEDEMFIHTRTRPIHPDSSIDSEEAREAPGILVEGVHPYLTKRHALQLPHGVRRQMWHDGSRWRVSHEGWGDASSDIVVAGGVTTHLDTSKRYELVEDEADTRVTRLRAQTIPES